MIEKKRKIQPIQVVLFSILLLYVVSLFVIVFWALMTSFRSPEDFYNNMAGLPKEFELNLFTAYENFIGTDISGNQYGFLDLLKNAVLYSLGCAVMSTLTPCIVAYLCAKFKYKFSNVIYMTVIIVMIIPIVGNQPSEIKMAQILGIYDTIWGMWIMKTTFLGMYFLIFHAIFSSLPNGYAEAAKIDGAGNVQIMFRIMFPLAKNTIITVGLLMFISFWNDYSVPMVYIPSYPVLASALVDISSIGSGLDIPVVMAATMILFIPMFVVFLVLQKRLMGNLTAGGLKG